MLDPVGAPDIEASGLFEGVAPATPEPARDMVTAGAGPK
jgi:hypothetical protein